MLDVLSVKWCVEFVVPVAIVFQPEAVLRWKYTARPTGPEAVPAACRKPPAYFEYVRVHDTLVVWVGVAAAAGEAATTPRTTSAAVDRTVSLGTGGTRGPSDNRCDRARRPAL